MLFSNIPSLSEYQKILGVIASFGKPVVFILDYMRATYFERSTEEPFYLLFLSEVNYLIRLNPTPLVLITFVGIEQFLYTLFFAVFSSTSYLIQSF
jgi:hypothetical protein